jgi:hypothetical protein
MGGRPAAVLDVLTQEVPVTGGDTMNATKTLHEQGQSLWLDNITRDIF